MLIVQEILQICTCNRHSVVVWPIFNVFDELIVMRKLEIKDIFPCVRYAQLLFLSKCIFNNILGPSAHFVPNKRSSSTLRTYSYKIHQDLYCTPENQKSYHNPKQHFVIIVTIFTYKSNEKYTQMQNRSHNKPNPIPHDTSRNKPPNTSPHKCHSTENKKPMIPGC